MMNAKKRAKRRSKINFAISGPWIWCKGRAEASAVVKFKANPLSIFKGA